MFRYSDFCCRSFELSLKDLFTKPLFFCFLNFYANADLTTKFLDIADFMVDFELFRVVAMFLFDILGEIDPSWSFLSEYCDPSR